MHFTIKEKALLQRIKEAKRFTVVRLELRSSKESDLVSTALNHMHIDCANETMTQVKETSALLSSLEEQGIIKTCYRLPVSARSDYQVYYDSQVFKELGSLVQAGQGREGFLFDTPWIKRGVVTITQRGREAYYE